MRAKGVLGKHFSTQGSFVVADITKVEPPSPEEIAKNMKRFQTQAEEKLTQLASRSLIKKLRAGATIDVSSRIESDL